MHNLQSMCILTVLTAGFINDVKAMPTGGVECGVARTGRIGRIINGSAAGIMQIPWIASIKHNGVHKCGSSIISGRYLLSAAHCFDDVLKVGDTTVQVGSNPAFKNWAITLGEYTQRVDEDFSFNYSINKIIVHEGYRRKPLLNDIVLLELTEYIQWSDHIQPICLPVEDVNSRKRDALAAGWGRDISIAVEDNHKLRYVHLDIFDNDYCMKMYWKKNTKVNLDKTQMCAGKDNGETRDTTEGDSGGPLLVHIGGRQVLVGITSTGAKDTTYPKPPGIYTKVFEFMDWIKTHIDEIIYYSPVLTNNKLD